MEVCKRCKGLGRVLDYVTNKYIPCPDCEKRRKEEIRTGAVTYEKFGLEAPDLTNEFSYTKAVKYSTTMFTKASVEKQKAYITKLLQNLEKHTRPEESVCFGLGKHGRPDVLAYAIAGMAYSVGATVAPVITCRKLYELSVFEKPEVSTYINAEILIVVIPVNPTRASLRHSVGIMQERAMDNKPTIFITTYEENKCKELLARKGERATKWLAKPVFVEYKEQKNEEEAIAKDNIGLIEEE